MPLVRRVVSGGQTGVDRAGLDAAIALGLDHGGWCPQGRLAEDGTVPSCYELSETDSADYRVRTEKNVIDSDGTLILYDGRLQGGTLLTQRLCRKHCKPHRLVQLERSTVGEVREWLSGSALAVLNVAGPRESSSPGIGARALAFLLRVLEPGDS